MKCLLDPLFSIRDTRKCAGHYSLTQVARHVLDTFPDSFIYYIAPGKECFIFEKTLEQDYPGRVKYFDGYHLEANRLYQQIYRPDWYQNLVSATGYAWDWDVLLTMRTGMDLVRWLNCLGLSARKKIVVYDQFPVFEFRPAAGTFFGQRGDHQLSGLVSYAVSDRVVMAGPEDIEKTLKLARTYLAPSQCKRLQEIMREGFVVPDGLDFEFPLKKSPKPPGQPVKGIFVRRLSSIQRPELVLGSFFYPFVLRPPGTVEFQISTNSLMPLPPEWRKKYNFVQFFQANRQEFYERVKQSDFAVHAIKSDTVSSSLIESICWGCIPIMYRSRWSEELAGKDYRFLFDDLKEAVVHVAHIVDHFSDSLEYFKNWYQRRFLPFLKRGEGLVQSVEEMIEELSEDIQEYCAPRLDKLLLRQMIDFVAENRWERFTFFELLDAMHKEGIVRVNPNEKGVGFRPQVHIGRWLPARNPRYYEGLHCLLQKTGWQRSVDVGGVIVS